MKKITTVLAIFVLALFATSCSSEQTLQGYLVESQEKDGFMTIDIPINFIKPKSLDVSEDVQKNSEIDIQELTDSYVKKIDNILDVKEKEIMTV